MKIKTIILTGILIIGFSLQDCSNCDCSPIEGHYFDIQGLTISHFNTEERVEIEETVEVNEYLMLIDFSVEYYGSNMKSEIWDWNFSLINTAYACSCAYNGENGSKDEKLSSFTVITLNDFDEIFLAKDTINDLLDVKIFLEETSLVEHLSDRSSLIYYEGMSLKLRHPPTSNEDFQVKIIMELSTGEVYEATSEPIRIID